MRLKLRGWVAVGFLAAVMAPRLRADEPAPRDGAVPADHAERISRGETQFKDRVAKVLRENCSSCHGGKSTHGDFDLSTRELLLKGSANGPVIKPFSSAESSLLPILRHEAEPFMPDGKPKLSNEAIAAIAEWIDNGAPYTEPLIAGKSAKKDRSVVTDNDRAWWSFQPLSKVTPPATPESGEPISSPIDLFLLRAGESQRIAFAPIAERRVLIRRATLDLTGVPPTADEIAAFLADSSPSAWEKMVDRLLASPRYGERWARHWLDVARFAESSGFEHDYDRPGAFHYRDYVIRAFNADQPFDEFTRWQIAGDEIRPGDPAAMSATGFLGAGVFPTQITANEVERTRYDAMDDMLSTTSVAFLGLTVGCARCHDHKFDPIPAADYYSMLSAFTTTVRSNVDLVLDPETTAREQAAFDAHHAALVTERSKFETERLRPEFEAWLAGDNHELNDAPWSVAAVEKLASQNGATFRDLGDGSWLAEGANPADDIYTIRFTANSPQITALRLEALAHSSLPGNGPGRASNGNFALSRISITAKPAGGGDAKPVRIRSAAATHEQNNSGLSVASSLDDSLQTGWAVDGAIGRDQAAVFLLEEPISASDGVTLEVRLEFFVNTSHCIGRPRISFTTAANPMLDGGVLPASVAAVADRIRDHQPLELAERDAVFAWWRLKHTADREWQKRLDEHAAKRPTGKSPVLVCGEGYPPIVMHSQGKPFFEETYVLRRGDTTKKAGLARLGLLQVLHRESDLSRWAVSPPSDAKFSGRRSLLANWITDLDHGCGALLARVTVNRLWQHHFGRGIVATPNDFGRIGSPPSQPELLEWLAGEFVRSGWKQKPIHRLIMTSRAYQQSSVASDAAMKADPENRLFLRFTPRRLEAESLRDSILFASGSLDPTMFGAGSLDEHSRRRSIYLTVKRSQLMTSMLVFDAPEPLVSQAVRPSTTVAPQALLLMNSPQVRSWSVEFARRLIRETQSDGAATASAASTGDPQRISAIVSRGYLVSLGRDPSESERTAATAFIQAGLTAGEEQAVADFCQVLFSLNEFAYMN